METPGKGSDLESRRYDRNNFYYRDVVCVRVLFGAELCPRDRTRINPQAAREFLATEGCLSRKNKDPRRPPSNSCSYVMYRATIAPSFAKCVGANPRKCQPVFPHTAVVHPSISKAASVVLSHGFAKSIREGYGGNEISRRDARVSRDGFS
jgi:hypothetical protein